MAGYRLKFLWIVVCTLIFSCDIKQENGHGNKTGRHYSLGVRVEGSSYAVAADHLSDGTIAVQGNGVKLDATSMITSGKYMYFFNRSEKKFCQYELKPDGRVKERASLLVGQYVTDWAYSQNLLDENTILVMDPLKWGEPEIRWLTISIPDFVVSANGSFALPAKEQSPGVNWKSNIGNAVLHGKKLIMGTVYYDFSGNFAPGAHVVTFDYPGMKNPTLISTSLITAELGIYSTNGFATCDNGDLYVAASRGALWGAKSDSDVYGAILRIKKGETRFDESYFLNLSKAVGAPANIMQLDYIGGTSAMAILFDDTRIKGWGDVANDHYYFARVNLESGTLSRYNIPNSDAHNAKRPLISDNKYITFLKSTSGHTTHILEIDLEGGPDAFTKGALISGKNVKGYSITEHPDKQTE